jgi:putative ABC transport system ATP-binding protein
MEIMGVFQRLNDQGITVVLVTHEPDIAQYSKRMVAMKDGRMILDQPVRKRRSASVELAAAPLEEVLQ